MCGSKLLLWGLWTPLFLSKTPWLYTLTRATVLNKLLVLNVNQVIILKALATDYLRTCFKQGFWNLLLFNCNYFINNWFCISWLHHLSNDAVLKCLLLVQYKHTQ